MLGSSIVPTVLLAFICLSAPVASATPFLYSLSGVTFEDGATASGYFVYDPTSGIISSYNISTSDGLTGLNGSHYLFGAGYNYVFNNGFGFGTDNPSFIFLETFTFAGAPGTYHLFPGHVTGVATFGHSGEFTPDPSNLKWGVAARAIVLGSLVVTPLSVPEAGQSAALLGLGLLGLVLFHRSIRHAGE